MTSVTVRRAARGPVASLVKRVAFASPEISVTILYATVNSWYLYYLVNIAGVPPFLAGLAFAFGRMFDAFADPFIGRWLDAGSGGRSRKRVIGAALVPAAVAFTSIWIMPAVAQGAVLKTVCAAACFAAFALTYSLANVPRLSMLPRYEADYHGRTAQVGFNMGFHFVSLLVAIAGVPLLIAMIDGSGALSGTLPRSWWLVAGCLAVAACAAYVPFLMVVPDQEPAISAARVGLSSVLRVRGIPLILAAFTLSAIALVSIQSMLPFFLESYVGIPKSGHPPVLGAVMAASLLSLPIWVACGRLLGKRRGLICGLVSFALFLGLTATIEAGSGLSTRLFLAAVLAGASVAALSVFPWAMVPDTADLYLNETGRPGEGLCTATFMFFNQLAASCAVFANGWFLSLAGHIGGQAEQTALTVRTIYGAMVFGPLLFAGLCLVAVCRLPRHA